MEGQKIQAGHLHGRDEVEDDQHRDPHARQHDNVRARDGRDRPGGPQHRGVAAHQDVSDTRQHAPGQVEGQVAHLAEAVVDGIAEDPQEDHVTQQVQQAAVEKDGTEKLEQLGRVGVQQQVVDPQHALGRAALVTHQVHQHVGRHQGVVHPGYANHSIISADGYEHLTAVRAATGAVPCIP